MAEQTGISWCDATFNPWVGCAKVSPGCARCYAETLVTGRMGRPGTWGEDGTRERTSVANWRKPLAWARTMPETLGRRPRVFCASLADVFEPRPELDPWRADLFRLIEQTPELDWLILTKRPDVARDWLNEWYSNYGEFPTQPLTLDTLSLLGREWVSRDGIGWGVLPNVWIGTSIENARHTYRADILREIPAAVRFISAEPLLGSLFDAGRGGASMRGGARAVPPSAEAGGAEGSAVQTDGRRDVSEAVSAAIGNAGQEVGLTASALDLTGIDWVIVGGESGGRDARPMHPQWAREIRDAMLYPWSDPHHDIANDFREWFARRGVSRRPALHFKQWGSWTPDDFGRDPDGVWVSPDGRSRTRLAADAYDDLPDGSMRMRYAGASPKAGGKLLDGVDWCEFPTTTEKRVLTST